MQIKHVIWDWNGTLLDDIDVSMDALNVLLKKEKLPLVLDKEEYRRYFQFPVIEYYKKVGFDFENTPFSELAQEYMNYYQPHSLHCHLHEGVREVLAYGKKLGIHQYVLSASNLEFLREQIAVYDIAPYFDRICGLDNIHAHSKAELAKEFVEVMKFDKEEVVFIGDSVHDSEVAKGAGCHCILIANGHEHKDKLLTTGFPVVDSINEIKQMLRY
ncbi:HAD family hydrolase [Amedibacillus sp. YH-ame6]